jgi:hypothetical protein
MFELAIGLMFELAIGLMFELAIGLMFELAIGLASGSLAESVDSFRLGYSSEEIESDVDYL